MQKTYRYLANNKVVIVADLAGFVTEYRPVYQRTLEVYKGIDNLLYFEVKNHDQKNVDLTSYTPTIVVFDENQNMVIKKTGTVLDDTKTVSTTVADSENDTVLEFLDTTGIEIGQRVYGFNIQDKTLVSNISGNTVTVSKPIIGDIPLGTDITFQTKNKKGVFTVNINEGELLDIKNQYLSYAIYLVDSNSQKVLTYSDSHFGAEGLIHLKDTVMPGPMATYSVSQFLRNAPEENVWVSESIEAQPALNGNSALHTVAIYSNNFIGDVTIQGTLQNQVTNNTVWADVSTISLNSEVEPIPINFNGVYSYLRFKIEPEVSDENYVISDYVNKILIRN